MSTNSIYPLPRLFLQSFLRGALWGCAAGVIEALLFDHWYHVELPLRFATLELALNYMLFVGLDTAILTTIVAAVRGRARQRSSRRIVEALVAAALLVSVAVNYLVTAPLAQLSLVSFAGILLIAGALVVLTVLVWGIRHALRETGIAITIAVAVVALVGLLWQPFMGRLSGGPGPKVERREGLTPNVLLIVTDTLRRDFLSCYGAAWGASPAADSLAASGTLFADHVAQSTWTLPSTASLLTSLFPSSHGAVRSGVRVSSSAHSIAEVFDAAGYRTAAFTENLHILPRNGFGRGFDEFWAIWVPWVYGNSLLQRACGRLHVPTIDFTAKEPFPDKVTSPTDVNWDARVTTDRMLDWLNNGDNAPFFAYVHYMGPHGPYGPPEYLLDRPAPDAAVDDHPRPMGDAYPLGESGAPVTPAQLDEMRTLYAADIAYVDREIGRLLDWLDEMEIRDETLVVFTSDHGEEFYEHGAWNHGSTAFEEVLAVPLIISSPGIVPVGQRIDECTRHIDVMPTILDLAGLEGPEEMQGRSLRAWLEGDSIAPLPAYTEVYPVRPPDCSIVSLVHRRFKIINVQVQERTAVLLYDLDADPGEQVDLSGLEQDRLLELLGELDVWDRVARQFSPETEAVPLDPQTLKVLKSLGYIN